MEEIKADIRMTKLGQMLLDEGLATGCTDMIRIIRHKLSKGLNSVETAEFLKMDHDYIEHIYTLLLEHTNMTNLQIAELL